MDYHKERIFLSNYFIFVIILIQYKNLFIRAESSRIQELGKRYNGFTNQQNLLSHKWFKNTTDLDHKL